MLKTLVRWGLFFIALLAAGPLAWLATGRLGGPDGGHDTTPLLSTAPALGILLAIAAIALAGLVGIITAKLVNLHSALFNTGLVLAWAAFGTGTIDAVARSSGNPSMGWRLAIEGAILALAAIPFAYVICRLAPLHTFDPRDVDERSPMVRIAPIVLIGLLAGFAASWLIAQNFLKGQTIAAAAVGGLIAAAVALVFDHRAPPAAILAGVLLMACAGPLAGAIMHGSGFQPTAAVGIKLARFAGVLPLDWVAGAFLGSPLGFSLGSWIAEGRQHKPRPAAA